MGLPSFASSSQSDAGVTRATLTPGTLILNKDSHPTVTDIKSLGINTELSLANQQVNKPNIDKLKENQEIAALTGQVGSFVVGELGQRMGLEEGSWQKAALHGAVGALSAQLSKGNVKAGAAAGAATEVINTQIANALAAHTDLSPQARNNLQQVTAMVAGATAGNLVGNNTNSTVQGANTGLASEVFNRQLHPKELQQIHDHVKEFAKQQGITEEEAERQLTEETLRGASDDFANVKENRVARAYLNQLQRMEDGQHLFGVLDRNSSEYKNSLINAQYVTPNKDLYNRVNRDSKNYATTTADYVLNAAIREGKRNYQQAGKETVSQVYGNARAEANRYRDLERYHSEQESKQDQSLARKYSRQANSLTSAMAENYTSGTGLFSLKELYTNKDPLAKAMFENIAESGYAIGVVSSTRMIFKDAKIGNFVSKDKLLSHFDKHSGEFGNLYTTPTDYLIGARYVMNLGIPVEYMYKGELRNGFIKYLGNTSKKGEAKFAFVGTNLDHNITTYHTKSGKEFWRLLNNDYTHKVIYPKGEKK